MNKLIASILFFVMGAASAADITGAGATFPYPIYSKWAEAYKASTGIGFAVAQNSQVPIVKACVDNKTSALFASSNGNCPKGRTAIDIGSTGANVKSIAQLVSPSVVSISVTATLGGGTGSGSIYQTNSNNSYILTNNHVIEGAVSGGTINVELNNGDVVPATIVGRDPAYDLAVLQIKRGNMPAINFGDSTGLSIGDPVVAFGSPLGLSGTVTSGIVSAINRPVTIGQPGVFRGEFYK